MVTLALQGVNRHQQVMGCWPWGPPLPPYPTYSTTSHVEGGAGVEEAQLSNTRVSKATAQIWLWHSSQGQRQQEGEKRKWKVNPLQATEGKAPPLQCLAQAGCHLERWVSVLRTA